MEVNLAQIAIAVVERYGGGKANRLPIAFPEESAQGAEQLSFEALTAWVDSTLVPKLLRGLVIERRAGGKQDKIGFA
jgi:hypothetical protein